MDEIRVKLDHPDLVKASLSDGNLTGNLGSQNVIKVVSSVSSASTITSINQLEDINTDNAQDGNLLIYNGTSEVWEVSDELDGGEY